MSKTLTVIVVVSLLALQPSVIAQPRMPTGQTPSETQSEDGLLWSNETQPRSLISGLGSLRVAVSPRRWVDFVSCCAWYKEPLRSVRDADGRIRGITQREVAKEEREIAQRVQSGAF